jgi:DNA-binding transcriptional LysR family regulator
MTDAQLAAVLAVAQEGSFSRAAERLMVSQPAISLHVAELEGKLKLKLFDRLPRATRPTEAGRVLAEFARRIQGIRAEAEHAMADLRGLRRGRLAVGATLTIGAYLLPELLGRFRRAHPEIELELVVANTEDIQQRLRDATLDVGFTEGEPGGDGLQSTVFAQDELIAIAPPGHPLLEHKRVTAAMFCRYPLLAREAGSGTRAVAERALASRGIAIKPALVLPQAEAIMRCVAEGLGVAILSELAAGREVASGRLMRIKLSDLTIRRPLYVERLSGRATSSALAALLAAINS